MGMEIEKGICIPASFTSTDILEFFKRSEVEKGNEGNEEAFESDGGAAGKGMSIAKIRHYSVDSSIYKKKIKNERISNPLVTSFTKSVSNMVMGPSTLKG